MLADGFVSSAFDDAFDPVRVSRNFSDSVKEDYFAAIQFHTELSTGIGTLDATYDSLFTSLLYP